MYCDTDSAYLLHYDRHLAFFDAYNKRARQKNQVWVDRVNKKRGFDRN